MLSGTFAVRTSLTLSRGLHVKLLEKCFPVNTFMGTFMRIFGISSISHVVWLKSAFSYVLVKGKIENIYQNRT